MPGQPTSGKRLTRAEARELVTETAIAALGTAFDYTLTLGEQFGEKMTLSSRRRVAVEYGLLLKHLRTRALNARLKQRKEKEDGKQE